LELAHVEGRAWTVNPVVRNDGRRFVGRFGGTQPL